MYRSGISSQSITTLEHDDLARPSFCSRNIREAEKRNTASQQQPVDWRTLALALTSDSTLSASAFAKCNSGRIASAGLLSKSRPKTASSTLPSSTPEASLRDSGSAHLFRDWLLREGVAVAGNATCKTMKFSSEYYETLSRMVELQAKALPLSADQVAAGIKLIWAHAPPVNRCLHTALQLEAASVRTGTQVLSRENCVEVIACCLKWMHFIAQTDPNAPVSDIRRCIIAVSDSIFIDLQPAVWRVAMPVSAVRRLRLIDVARPLSASLLVTTESRDNQPRDSDSRSHHSSSDTAPPSPALATGMQATAIVSDGTSYAFRGDVLVKKKLSAECIPAWLQGCSDQHFLEAAFSCPTFFEACEQFAKQEQHSRQQSAKIISEIRGLHQGVAVLCREEDAAVRHAFALDWDRSNLFRSVQLAREELENKQTVFDELLNDMIRRQNELLKQVQEVRQHCRLLQICYSRSALFSAHSHPVYVRPSSACSCCGASTSTAKAFPPRSSRWSAVNSSGASSRRVQR